MQPRFFCFLAGLLMLSGCSPQTHAPQTTSSTSPGTVVWIPNGWSADERAEFHHLSEGSELIPYDLLANLTSVKTGKPFLQNIERFGFIPDATSALNPHGLPIGLTAGHSRNVSHIGLEVVGFNCAG